MTHELALAPPFPPDPDGYEDPTPDPSQRWSGSRVDLAAAQRAAADFLAALGIDLDGDGLRETPARMARAYAELFEPRPLRLTTFDNAEGYDELVIARAIPFRGSPGRWPSACCSACAREAPGWCLRPSTPA
jgi:hypothetical protein